MWFNFRISESDSRLLTEKAKACGLAVIDAGHYGTEKSFAGNFAEKLRAKVADGIEIIQSEVDIDPFEMI